MTADSQTFIHLSDIHFRTEAIGEFDLDEDIRHELEQDARKVVAGLGDMDGILVTGDIAFAGKQKEYEEASDWLRRLSDIVGCADSEVWTVPGNHDVDRSELNKSPLLRRARQDLREANNLNGKLRAYLHEDDSAGELLLQPFSNYNDFASKFGCEVSQDGLYWEHEFPLGEVWRLRLRGVHSAIVSNESDDTQANKLVLGEYQAQIKREPGVVNVVLCHHPPDWLADYEVVQTYFNNRASLQLFGHKHSQNIEKVEESLRVVSGAMHPSRGEDDWKPRYNFVNMSIVSINDADPTLEVKVYPRVWEGTEFVADRNSTGGSEYCTYRLSIDGPPVRSKRSGDMAEQSGIDCPEDPEDREDDSTSGDFSSENRSEIKWEADMDPRRELLYRYHSLPYHSKLSVALELDLLRDEDQDLPTNEMFNQVLKRARDHRKLAALWEQVEEHYEDDRGMNNPFD